MDKELCIVHANCQGPPIIERLLACPQFEERYECKLFTNYEKEPIFDELIGHCSLFLYQHLGSAWGDLASENILKKLPESARHLCIPNMFFKGYWPLWSGKEGFNYRCLHLDEFIDMGLSPEETVLLFLRSDVERKYDLLELLNKTFEQERNKEKQTPIKYVELLIEHYRDEMLFNTINHPNSRLINHAAKGILKHLGFDAPDDAALESLGEPFPDFEQPINPRIGQFFGWDFAKPDIEFEIYGRKIGYARYVANYVAAREAGIADFIGYLQGEYIKI
ncbi:MAG: WcbI family polysaccharide biosynthesis putative acetyltransferase [Pseudodesulfovibrio sp.]